MSDPALCEESSMTYATPTRIFDGPFLINNRYFPRVQGRGMSLITKSSLEIFSTPFGLNKHRELQGSGLRLSAAAAFSANV